MAKRRMRRRRPQGPSLSFMGLALFILVFTDLVIFGGYKDLIKGQQTLRQAHLSLPGPEMFLGSEVYDYQLSKEYEAQKRQKLAQEIELTEAMEEPPPQYLALSIPVPQPNAIPNENTLEPSSGLAELEQVFPKTEKTAAATYTPTPDILNGRHPILDNQPVKVAIIIDDLGMSHNRTNAIVDIRGPLTLAFLPYAPNLDAITERARTLGHELIIHVPMEPLNSDLNPGPLALWDEMSREQFDIAFEQILESFDGYIGINNHMGSRLTQNRKIMDWVMRELAERNLIFVDSKTISSSIAAERANANNVYHAERDVFLDHVDTREFVDTSLKQLEAKALEKGFAIAIGHPKIHTIEALRDWLPTLRGKNIELVPISELVSAPSPTAENMVQATDEKPALPVIAPVDGFKIKLPDYGIGGTGSSL